MKALITTNWGFEDITASEIKNLTKKDVEPKPYGLKGRVLAKIKSIEEACKITYLSQTANRVLVFIDHFKIETDKNGLKSLYDYIKKIDFYFIKPNTTFAVRSERIGTHEYTSMDIMKYAGQAIIDSCLSSKNFRPKVNLTNPDIIIRVDVIKEDVLVGIDLVGKKSLHKRGYKIYNHPAALKPTLANQLVRYSQWDPKKQILLDPFCGSGTIPIEAGIYAKNIPGGYWKKKNLQFIKLDIGIDWDEWFEDLDDTYIKDNVKIKGIIGSDKIPKYIKGAEYNSQKALVRDLIRWSRIEIEWIDLKLDKNSIDLIVTNPPYGKKIGKKSEVEKCYKYLFYQADWILTEQGKIIIISPRKRLIEKYSKEYNFKPIDVKKVWNGMLEVFLYTFIKNK